MTKNIKNENQDLKNENQDLKNENLDLKRQLQELNENTIVESMNDMKHQYEVLKNNSVSFNTFLNLKNYYKESCNTNISINSINNIILEDFQDFYDTINSTLAEPYKSQRIKTMFYSINSSLLIISKLIDKNEDQWSENMCDCENY